MIQKGQIMYYWNSLSGTEIKILEVAVRRITTKHLFLEGDIPKHKYSAVSQEGGFIQIAHIQDMPYPYIVYPSKEACINGIKQYYAEKEIHNVIRQITSAVRHTKDYNKFLQICNLFDIAFPKIY